MTSKRKNVIKEIEFYASLQEFSRHTAIPWFKCFFDPRFSYRERFFITAILSVAFVYTSSLVYAVFSSVFSYPIVTNIESLQHPAWEQPFPTVYVCPLNRISKDGIVKQVDKWILPKNITKKAILKELRAIPNGAYRLTSSKYSEIIAKTMEMNNVSLYRLLDKITLPCEKMIGFCKWKSVNIDCKNIFVKIATPEGPCCAFNYIHPRHEFNGTLKTMAGSGFTTGLKVALFINYSDGFSSLSSSRGYFLQEFSRHTAIPWFKCFFDPRFSYRERFFITAILSVAFVYTSSLVYAVFSSVFSYPIVTNIESLQHPAWEQPFPTVYVCPLNRISKDGIVKQVDKWILPKNITKKAILKELRAIPNGAYRLTSSKYSEIIAKTMEMNNVSLYRLLDKITLPCEKMIGFCKWKSVNIDCKNIFVKIATPEGPCCAFNYIHPRHDFNGTLKTMAGSGFTTGLKVALFINYSDGFSSLSSSRGYFVYAGTPGTHTDGRALGRVLRRRAANFYSFTSTRIEYSKAVMKLPIRYRVCSANDHKLAAFKLYTLTNCKSECILNISLNICHCVPIMFPKYSDDQRYCGFSDIKCLHTIKDAVKYIISGTNLSQYSEDRLEMDNARPCNCHSTCEAHYDFDVAVSSSPIDMELYPEYFNKDNWDDSGELKDMIYYCDVYIYSQGNMLTKVITDVRYDNTEIMGFLGTIASFTMGWSIICVIEILHFLIQLAITYCINKIKDVRQVKQLHPNNTLQESERKSRY